jgi:hypothetical protein
MPSIVTAAPQFLVTKLSTAITFYEEHLGFVTNFVYADFYASVSSLRQRRPIQIDWL